MIEWLASIPVLLKVLVFIGSGLVLLLVAYLFYRLVVFWISLNKLDLKDRFAIKNDFIKTTAQIMGGAFFLVTIYFTYQNLLVSENNLAETQEKNKADLSIARDKQTIELYVKAIEQLGSDKLEVRLGGIYALERIARESPKDHWPIMEVLTAYVRENAPSPPEELSQARKKRPWSRKREIKMFGEPHSILDHDIQAVLTVLGRTAIVYAQKGEKRRLFLYATYLEGAYLERANLQEADLSKANLQGAKLFAANLQGAILLEANLQKAKLMGANFQKAYLLNANLQGAELQGANLQGAELRWANLQKAYLHEANLQGAELNDANLQEASLSGANLLGVHLARTNLQKAYLREANLIGADLYQASLHRANLTKANLQGAELCIANLQGANLLEANLQGAILCAAKLQRAILKETKLQGADFRNCEGLTAEQLAEAFWDEDTKWPEGFTPPAPRREEKQKGE